MEQIGANIYMEHSFLPRFQPHFPTRLALFQTRHALVLVCAVHLSNVVLIPCCRFDNFSNCKVLPFADPLTRLDAHNVANDARLRLVVHQKVLVPRDWLNRIKLAFKFAFYLEDERMQLCSSDANFGSLLHGCSDNLTDE